MTGAVIVVEGPDGIGKSTLLDHVAGLWPGRVVRHSEGPPPKDVPPALHYSDRIEQMESEALGGALVLCDRLHLGELAYGPLLRGASEISWDEAAALDMQLDGIGAILALCHLDPSRTIGRMMARDGGIPDPKSGAKIEQAHALHAAFSGAQRAAGGRWKTIDTARYPAVVAKDLLSRIDRAARYMPGRRWVGPFDAPIVVYGEDPGWARIDRLAVITRAARLANRVGQVAVVTSATNLNDGDISFQATIDVSDPLWMAGADARCVMRFEDDHQWLAQVMDEVAERTSIDHEQRVVALPPAGG